LAAFVNAMPKGWRQCAKHLNTLADSAKVMPWQHPGSAVCSDKQRLCHDDSHLLQHGCDHDRVELDQLLQGSGLSLSKGGSE
jgi:hypothetical protein